MIAVGIALALAWLALVAFIFVARPRGSVLREALRILPDTVRLLRRLAADPSLPREVRVRLWLLLVYLAIPIDLVPDFIPVVGYADDAVIVAPVLRSVVRRAGRQAVRRHWPGTEDGVATLWRVASLEGP
ncbi:MAG TPA: YkvA family protein [Actinomycetota bacterium]|nr:YkvA family protein [Actinomycetota bacterium]